MQCEARLTRLTRDQSANTDTCSADAEFQVSPLGAEEQGYACGRHISIVAHQRWPPAPKPTREVKA